MAERPSLSHQSDAESVLGLWRRLEVSLDVLRATKALREAVRALEVIRGLGGPAGDAADAAILRVEHELLQGEVDIDA